VTEFEWTVGIRANLPKIQSLGFKGGTFEGEYVLQSAKRYFAIRDALEKLISENNLPFRPYELQNTYRHLVEISAKCSEDGRVAVR
jgi:hypothetical protein